MWCCLRVQLWPVLAKAAQKYASDFQVTERLFRCIRYALRCLGKRLTSLFNPVLTQVSRVHLDAESWDELNPQCWRWGSRLYL